MHSVIVAGRPCTPSKIVCVGRNYAAHIHELGNEIPSEMVVFNKPNSALGTNLRAFFEEPLHYEGELAFLVRDGRYYAVGFGLDLTRRKLQSALKADGLPWERAKAFDGAALFSEFVPLPDRTDSLALRLEVDGQLRQQGGVELMMYKPDSILRELARYTRLEDHDIVMTGTPAGVGEIRAGEVFEGYVLDGERVLVSGRWQAA